MSAPAMSVTGPIEVPLADVEAELSRMLKEAQGPGHSPIHRARMSNLIIHCATSERAAEVEAIVPQVVSFHPARVLLLIADDHTGTADIRASVLVRKAGSEAQLCSEQVTLRGGPHAAEHLPFAVRGLLIGDLPTNVWWTDQTAPALAGPILDDLAESAQQVIYDSIGWLEPHRGVAATAPWLDRFERGPEDGRWRVASDLNWRRLKIWRRLIAQGFAPAGTPGALESVSEILIEHGPHAVTQAWQVAGWLASRLGWKIQATRYQDNVEVSFQISSPRNSFRLRIRRLPEGPSEIRRLHVACTIEGQLGALNFVAEEGRLSAQPEGIDAAPRTISVPTLDTADIVGRQLSDREPDPVFREAMASAAVMAKAILR